MALRAGQFEDGTHMRKVALFSVFIVFAFIAGCEQSTSKAKSITLPSGVHIETAEFGLFELDGGKATFVPAKTVPYSVNQAYGWVVKLQTKQERVKWREEFTLPSAPTEWGNPPDSSQQITGDRRTSILVREVTPHNGKIFNSWSVAAGDPRGRYTIRLVIENAMPVVFEFEVQ